MKLFCLIFLLYSYSLFPQEIQIAPPAQEFLDYMKKYDKFPITNNGYALNYVPSPVKPYFQKKLSKAVKSFPARYDLRDSSWVTAVKDQGNCGCCWAFSVLGSIESGWLQKQYGSFDLSEENMKNCHGFEVGGCTSGNAEMAQAYLTRGSGPVAESEENYTALDKPCNHSFTPSAFITASVYVPGDIEQVKQAVLDYGGLYTSLHWDGNYYSGATHAYYYTGNSQVNHAVLLVGWDDNKITGGKKGAWIAKNSWGTAWGSGGFFYLSYYDSKALTTVVCFPERISSEYNVSVLCHDKLGRTADFGYGTETAYALVRFKAYDKMQLSKTGLMVNTENTTVSIEVYSEKRNELLLNKLGETINYKCGYPGYKVIDLQQPVHFSKNEEFFIKVTYTTPGNIYPVPFENTVEGYSNPVPVANSNWISADNKNWKEFENNLCIRAYLFPDTVFSTGITDIRLFPNPSRGAFHIEFPYPEEDDITVAFYNSDGKLLFTRKISKEKGRFFYRFAVAGLPAGVYHVKIDSPVITKTEKMVFY